MDYEPLIESRISLQSMDCIYCESITNNRACVKDIECMSVTVGSTINEAIRAIQGTGGASSRLKTACKRDHLVKNKSCHCIIPQLQIQNRPVRQDARCPCRGENKIVLRVFSILLRVSVHKILFRKEKFAQCDSINTT